MIVRGPRPTERFTILNNCVIDDHRLSFRALGVLTFILSKPDHWRTDAATLARQGKSDRGDGDQFRGREGREALRAVFAELELCGYIERRSYRTPAGRFVTDTYVYDTPRDGLPGYKQAGRTGPQKPDTVNRTRSAGNGAPGAIARTDSNNCKQARPVPGTTFGRPGCVECDGTGWVTNDDGHLICECGCTSSASY